MIKFNFGSQKRQRISFGSLTIQMRLYSELQANGFLKEATCRSYISSLHSAAEKVACFPDSRQKLAHEQKLQNNVISLATRYEGKDNFGYELIRNAIRTEFTSKKNLFGRTRNHREPALKSREALTKITENFKQAQS